MPSGILEISAKPSEPPYPNPATTGLTIKINSPWSKYLKVLDVTGRQVEVLPIENDLLYVNTSAYKNGLYFYQILNNAAKVIGTGKFVVGR